MRVLILHDAVDDDARPDELDVLAQRDAVAGALREIGHAVTSRPFDLDLAGAAERLRGDPPDVVFNLVESVARQGRLIHLAPSLLDAVGLRYTGAPADAMFATSNKVVAKRVLRGAGLPTPDWTTLDELRAGRQLPPGRYIVKSIWEHGSLGLDETAVVDAADPDALQAIAAARAPSLGGQVVAERYVDGREFNLSLIADGDGGVEVLPVAEIEFREWPHDRARIVGYRAKWDPDSFEHRATPRRFDFPAGDAPLLESLHRIAGQCWTLFGMRGWARVDFRVDAGGAAWILDVNANPCLSPDAGFAAALERRGVPFPSAIRRILLDTQA